MHDPELVWKGFFRGMATLACSATKLRKKWSEASEAEILDRASKGQYPCCRITQAKMRGHNGKDDVWPYDCRKTCADVLPPRKPGEPLKRTDERFTYKRMNVTTDVATCKLITAIDAFVAKCGVKALGDVDWWQPKASQTVCPWTGEKSPAELPEGHHLMIRKALRYITGMEEMVCVRPLQAEEETAGVRYFPEGLANMAMQHVNPHCLLWRAKVRPEFPYDTLAAEITRRTGVCEKLGRESLLNLAQPQPVHNVPAAAQQWPTHHVAGPPVAHGAQLHRPRQEARQVYLQPVVESHQASGCEDESYEGHEERRPALANRAGAVEERNRSQGWQDWHDQSGRDWHASHQAGAGSSSSWRWSEWQGYAQGGSEGPRDNESTGSRSWDEREPERHQRPGPPQESHAGRASSSSSRSGASWSGAA
jgi:hypothetical protein